MSSHSDSFVASGNSPTDSGKTPPEPTIDIAFESHGSIVLIRGLSEIGQAWLDENVGDAETQYFGNAIAAEPRYCSAIILGARNAGLAVQS